MNYARLSSILFAATLLGSGVAVAAGLQVAAGCALPPATSTGKVFYIDPVNGSATGDGSSAHPWNSLQTITAFVQYPQAAWQPPGCKGNTDVSCTTGPLVASKAYSHDDLVLKKWATSTNPNAPIHPGDTILLMNGNYGDVSINGITNTSFITIAAAPNQTPVLSSIALGASTKWIVQGLTFRAPVNGYSAYIDVSGSAFYGPGSDIIIDSNDLSSQDNTSAWLPADWLAKARVYGIKVDGLDQYSTDEKCVTVTNNSISNVRNGIYITADNMLVEGNTIDNFGDDALDYAANNLVISNNRITNSRNLGDGNHNDAMQGQIGRGIAGTTVFNNILFDGNIVIAQTTRNLPFPGSLQGIDAFDMDWSNVSVINNIVITNAYHGISFYSLHGGLIANNTVLTTARTGTWIGVFDQSHEGASSNNVIVRNNIASSLDMDTPAVTVTTDHNLVAAEIVQYVKGQEQWLSNPGTYGSGNVIDPNGLAGVFQNFNLLTFAFNVHLNPNTLAVGTGNPGAPLTAVGTTRKAPVDLGAYVYQPPAATAANLQSQVAQ